MYPWDFKEHSCPGFGFSWSVHKLKQEFAPSRVFLAYPILPVVQIWIFPCLHLVLSWYLMTCQHTICFFSYLLPGCQGFFKCNLLYVLNVACYDGPLYINCLGDGSVVMWSIWIYASIQQKLPAKPIVFGQVQIDCGHRLRFWSSLVWLSPSPQAWMSMPQWVAVTIPHLKNEKWLCCPRLQGMLLYFFCGFVNFMIRCWQKFWRWKLISESTEILWYACETL
jgi:hypothetical protein